MWVAFMVIAQVSKYFYENIYITDDILFFSTAVSNSIKGYDPSIPSYPIVFFAHLDYLCTYHWLFV